MRSIMILREESKGGSMIRELPESQGAILGFEITGKVSLEEEKKWIERIEGTVREYEKVSTLVILSDEAHWGIKAGIEDLRWLTNHMKELDKVALVSDRKIWKWLVALDGPFAKIAGIKEKHFQPDKIEEAWKWIRE